MLRVEIKSIMLNVVVLSVIMLSVVILNVMVPLNLLERDYLNCSLSHRYQIFLFFSIRTLAK